MLNVDDVKMYNDFNGLAKLKQGAREQSPQAVKEVAKQFESLFLNMVMKSMRQAKLGDGLLDSQQSEFYQEMYDQQMAVHLADKQGIGLADVIAKQIGPKPAKESDQQSLQVSDYLDRAMGTSVKAVMPVTKPLAKSGFSVQPLDDSGLNRLQQSLDQLEKSQLANQTRWASLDRDDTVSNTLPSRELSNHKQAFMTNLLPYARQAASELGVDANLLLAQAALETGWGQSVVQHADGESSFNLFNIKADKSWQGKQTKVSALEYDGNVAKKTVSGFRAYDSYKQSFDDYVDFIKSNPRYSEALKKTETPAHYIRELQLAGYATDPRYAEKVMSIYRSQHAGQVPANAG